MRGKKESDGGTRGISRAVEKFSLSTEYFSEAIMGTPTQRGLIWSLIALSLTGRAMSFIQNVAHNAEILSGQCRINITYGVARFFRRVQYILFAR